MRQQDPTGCCEKRGTTADNVGAKRGESIRKREDKERGYGALGRGHTPFDNGSPDGGVRSA